MVTSFKEGDVLIHFSGLYMLKTIGGQLQSALMFGTLVWLYTNNFEREP